MNKDKRGLTETERRMLVLSEEQLYHEVEARVQMCFRPDPPFQEEIEKYAWMLKCSICKSIPFEIRQCIACEAIICESCKIRLLEGDQQKGAGSKNNLPGCPSCHDNPHLLLVSMKNMTAK